MAANASLSGPGTFCRQVPRVRRARTRRAPGRPRRRTSRSAMSDAERPHLRPVTDETPPVRVKPRLKWLRLVALLVPLGVLAVVSTVFGMMMAVASDLPALENEPQYQGKGGQNSVLLDVQGNTLGRLASDQHRIFV